MRLLVPLTILALAPPVPGGLGWREDLLLEKGRELVPPRAAAAGACMQSGRRTLALSRAARGAGRHRRMCMCE